MTEPKLKPIFVKENSDKIEHGCTLCGSPYKAKIPGSCTQPECSNAYRKVAELYKRFSFLFRNGS